MKDFSNSRFIGITIGFLIFVSTGSYGQALNANKPSKMDEVIQAGFDALSKKKWSEARSRFADARTIQAKEKGPSMLLYSKISLSDEDRSVPPKNEMEAKITLWRHSMGTEQALITFLALSSQLEGKNAEAEKYLNEVYGLQSPLWGLSWRLFIPPTLAVFHTLVVAEESENYGRYLFLSGRLLYSADEVVGLKLLREGQRLVPKDPEIAASLAGHLLINFDAVGAKKFADLSLSLKADQERVLIDLATANWLLGDLDGATKSAIQAQKLAPDLPGPHATLVLVAVEKNDLGNALKEAEIGVRLSERHRYYLTIQAVALEASDKKKEAEKLIKEAWGSDLPDSKTLERWFFRGKPLGLALKIVGRLI